MQLREKVGKSRNTVFFPRFVAPEGRKVGSLQRRVRSQLARWEMKSCTPLWREAHLQAKKLKTPHVRTTFGNWDVEKAHAVVARAHFPKHTMFGPLLEVEMSKKCTPSWHEAQVQVKMYKTHHCRTTFGSCDVEKVRAVLARSTFRSQNVKNTRVRTTFGCWDVVSRGRRKGLCTLSKVSKTWGFCSIFNYNHHYTTLHSKTLRYNYTFTTFHYTTLHSTTLHYTQLHSITLHYTALHYIPLHYIPLHYTTFHYTTLHSTTLRYSPLHSTTLHYTTLHYTTLHYTPLHYTQFYYTTLHYTTLRYTTFHYTTLH